MISQFGRVHTFSELNTTIGLFIREQILFQKEIIWIQFLIISLGNTCGVGKVKNSSQTPNSKENTKVGVNIFQSVGPTDQINSIY